LEFIGEEPLLIRLDEKPYSVVMRTPGEELFHAAGFCLGEGIVDSPDDFATIGFCRDLDPNVVDIRLKPERREIIPELLERRGFVSQTSCGICGKEMVKDLQQRLTPVQDGFAVGLDAVFACLDSLSENQAYYPRTRGSHAAVLFDGRPEMIAFAEDVGRHNALDKAIGKVFLQGKLAEAKMVVLSSRISYELVQKAARAHIPVMVSKSRPTALAVEMGGALNMTLAFPADRTELVVVCGEHRLLGE
ncbi:MAG: formate dehydrogenase accessory sulfurtransferase FdhD, partial [Desulfobacterales bacterium]